MKRLLVLIFVVFVSFQGISAPKNTDVWLIQEEDTTVHKKAFYVYDTAFVEKKNFSQESLTKFRQNRDFQYEEQEVVQNENGLSWWHKIVYKLVKYIGKFLKGFYDTFTNEDGQFTTVFYLVVLAIGAAITYFLYRIMQGKIFRKGKGTKDGLEYESSIENVHEMDFDALLQKAIQEQMYRRAVRILFLQSLKNLTDKKMILWQENKTNKAYYYEIKQPKIQEEFENISNVFDYVWYGEMEINQQIFSTIQTQFFAFSKQIEQTK